MKTKLQVVFIAIKFPYPLELPLLALYFTSPMKNSSIKRCSNCNWIKILTLVVASDTEDKGIITGRLVNIKNDTTLIIIKII